MNDIGQGPEQSQYDPLHGTRSRENYFSDGDTRKSFVSSAVFRGVEENTDKLYRLVALHRHSYQLNIVANFVMYGFEVQSMGADGNSNPMYLLTEPYVKEIHDQRGR